MIYDAYVNGVGPPYDTYGQQAAYGLFDNGYFITVTQANNWDLRHCDNPGVSISQNPHTYLYSGGRHASFGGKVYHIGPDSSGGNDKISDFYHITTNGSTVTTTKIKTAACTTLGTFPFGGAWVSPSGNVMATRSYYSSDTNVNPIYWSESFGFNTATGDQLWHYIWKDLGHTGARLYGIVSDNRILLRCSAHGAWNNVHLINTNDGSVLDTWPGNIPGSDNPTSYLTAAGPYGTTVGENLFLSTNDVSTPNNPKLIVPALFSTAGDVFTLVWLKYIQTDWLRTDTYDEGYPVPYWWAGSGRAAISTGGYSYSGGHFEQSLYIVDVLTGDISVGESTPWIVDGISFYTGGQFLSGFCGPDDLYLSIISSYGFSGYHHTYKVVDGGTTDKNSLYTRRLLTDGDTLAWADEEYEVPANWPRGMNLIARMDEFDGIISVTPEQSFAHEDAVSPVYWINPFDHTYAESETKPNSWLTSRGTGIASVMAGGSATVQHMEVIDNEDDGSFEKIWGCGTLTLWGSGVLDGLTWIPLRLNSRDDEYGTRKSPKLPRFQRGASQSGNRIGLGNNYQ